MCYHHHQLHAYQRIQYRRTGCHRHYQLLRQAVPMSTIGNHAMRYKLTKERRHRTVQDHIVIYSDIASACIIGLLIELALLALEQKIKDKRSPFCTVAYQKKEREFSKLKHIFAKYFDE